MSIGKRLLNVARAELGDAARRLKDSAEQILEGTSPSRASHEDPELEAIREQVRREEAERRANPDRAPRRDDVPEDVRRFYGNLELPIGASADEVKAAYRRLMRRYHPDKHALDPAQAKVATEISQQLREAYDGLLRYLGA